MKRRKFRLVIIAATIILLALFAKAWSDTMGDPAVLRTGIVSTNLPDDTPPVTIALISDIHVAGPDMPPERLEQIVTQINALKPDLVAIAGDLVSDKPTATRIYTPAEIAAPLGQLKAPLGVVVVPGNHDHWYDWPGLLAELKRYNIRVLANGAEQIGPLAFGGLNDDYTERADIEATLAAMSSLTGPRVMLSHSPDPFPDVPADFDLFLAGHTHCGQIAYPWGGAPAYLSEYGDRYACGKHDENGKVIITGAGLGTSLVPIRLFTQPEIWLIDIKPASESKRAE